MYHYGDHNIKPDPTMMRGMSTTGHSKGVIKSNPVPPLQYGYNQIYMTLTNRCSHKFMCK